MDLLHALVLQVFSKDLGGVRMSPLGFVDHLNGKLRVGEDP
jgi:hypothetical protein